MKRLSKKLCLYFILAFLMVCLFNILFSRSSTQDDLKNYDGKSNYLFDIDQRSINSFEYYFISEMFKTFYSYPKGKKFKNNKKKK